MFTPLEGREKQTMASAITILIVSYMNNKLYLARFKNKATVSNTRMPIIDFILNNKLYLYCCEMILQNDSGSF